MYLLQGNATKARKAFTEALALVDADSFEAGQLAEGLGQAATARGDTDTAVEQFERALAIYLEHLGEDRYEVAICLNNLANALSEVDSLDAAATAQYAVAVGERAFPDSPYHATAVSNLAYHCSEAGKPLAAIGYGERALAVVERRAVWSLDIALMLSNLAHYQREAGRDDLAAPRVQQLAALAPQLVDSGQETAAAILFSTATLTLELAKDAARAAELYASGLALRESLREPDDEVVLNTARNAAARLFVAGAADRAIELLDAAKRRWKHKPFKQILDDKLKALRAGDREAVIEDTEME